MLEVRLLGRFAIAYDGQPVTLSSRAAQSLFAYLTLTVGTFHRREKLAGMFWPDATEEKARAYLRHEIWRIRKAFPGSVFLLSDDIDVAFDASKEFQLDARMLEKLTDTASAEELMDALSAYQGELLPDFYDEWVIPEREHLQAVFEQKMVRLLGLLERERRWPEILEWAERWISLDQGPEMAYRSLMSAYTALADHAKVSATYERCVQALAELGLEPSEETRTIAKKRSSKINIPIPLTSFIGRENELKEVAALLSKSRLVTLTGSGGVGKTRLSIQVVADVLELFPDGIWFLELAPVSDPELVPSTLANVLDLRLMVSSDSSYTDMVTSYLRSRTALIIFDNCEHLIDACAQLAHSLLTACENLSILATSREALRVSGEISYRVPSLQLPELDIESIMGVLQQSESVRLFLERAAAISLGFTLGSQNALIIAQICQRLGGIPLAIELAAARVNVLTVDQILKRLDDRFNLLTSSSRTALPRHQTLRATIEWSYDLLSDREQLLFQRLAVFSGGWTLEAAEAVCSGEGIGTNEILDLLSQLVDKSLVLVEHSKGNETRYRRLETIRQFACEKLATSSEGEQIRARHLEYFLKLAERAELDCHSEKIIEWMQKLEDEHENLRTALKWSLEHNGNVGQKLAYALYWWWNQNGYWSEGYEWLQKMLSVNAESETLIKAKLLDAAAWLAAHLCYNEQSVALAEKSLAMFRNLGDKPGMATSLKTLGTRAYCRSDFDRATTLFEECCTLYREVGNVVGVATILSGLGYTAEAQGKFEQAQKFYEESMLLSKEIGDQESIGWLLYLTGNLAMSRGNNAEAMKLYEESLQITKLVKQNPHVSWILNAMGSAAICNGDYERGRLLLTESIDLYQKMGDQAGIAYALHCLAWGALLQRDYAKARSLYIESLQFLRHAGNEAEIVGYLIGVGQLMGAQGDLMAFTRLLGMAEGTAPNVNNMLIPLFRTKIFRNETEKFIDIARAALGDTVYTAAREAGKATSYGKAIDFAIKCLKG